MPYMGIRSGGRGIQASDWVGRIQDLVLELFTWLHE